MTQAPSVHLDSDEAGRTSIEGGVNAPRADGSGWPDGKHPGCEVHGSAHPCEECAEILATEFIQHLGDEDGYSGWVTPKPESYLMKCCDCGLVHELQFRVAKFQPRPSEEFVVVDDPDLQTQFRARRAIEEAPTGVATLRDALERVIEATHSHVDGRDLLAELHPRRMLDIKRRRDGVETWFEGDWLSNLWNAIKGARRVLDGQPFDLPRSPASEAQCSQSQSDAGSPGGTDDGQMNKSGIEQFGGGSSK